MGRCSCISRVWRQIRSLYHRIETELFTCNDPRLPGMLERTATIMIWNPRSVARRYHLVEDVNAMPYGRITSSRTEICIEIISGLS